ncbi:hypothetical protein K438DRAFT_1753612 [Mycena galopus ATCC 62051]|nr:hypothetical protein K438DRAFT_1753612 [Mycena galopus ATCC 62051]
MSSWVIQARHIPNPSPSSLSHRRWGSLVAVPPPLPPPSPPPPSSIPAAATAATPPAMEPTVSVASKKALTPNPIHFTPRNLYMAVYADEMGGSSHEFTQHWLSLATENPGQFQAHGTFLKELVMYSLRLSGLYLTCIYRSFGSSRTYLLLKIFDNTSKLFSEVPLHRRLASNDSAQRSGECFRSWLGICYELRWIEGGEIQDIPYRPNPFHVRLTAKRGAGVIEEARVSERRREITVRAIHLGLNETSTRPHASLIANLGRGVRLAAVVGPNARVVGQI